MRDNLPEIAHVIASTPGIRTVGLTTNGVKLAGCARELRQAGATHVNISLDSLDAATYEQITGTNALPAALDGLMAAIECGFEAVKTNTVVMRGINSDELPAIAALAEDLPIQARFIELMPLNGSTLDWESLFVPACEIRNTLGGHAEIIAPISERFCLSCNRVRVTCSGLLRPCLRLPLSYDISGLVCGPDAEERISALLEQAQTAKHNALAYIEAGIPARSMSSIGG